MSFSPQFLDQIKDQLELVSVLVRRVNLKKKAENTWVYVLFTTRKRHHSRLMKTKAFFIVLAVVSMAVFLIF